MEDFSMTKLQEEIMNSVSNDLAKKFDDILIEGLKKKGFEFNDKIELQNFIKENCTILDREDLKQRTYLVKNVPFFFHDYNIEFDLNIGKENKFIATYGHYAYL